MVENVTLNMTYGIFDVLKDCIHGFRSPEDDAALQRHRNAVARSIMIPRVSGINHESMPLLPLRRPISGDSIWSLQVGLHTSPVLLVTLKAFSPSLLSHLPKRIWVLPQNAWRALKWPYFACLCG
jgi:hypothetical protein